MAKKHAQPADSPETQALENRVKVIMGEDGNPQAPQVQPVTGPAEAPLDIFKDAPAPAEVTAVTVAPQASEAEAQTEIPANQASVPDEAEPAINLEAPATEKAVDNIVLAEGDAMLAAEDASIAKAVAPLPKPKDPKFKRLLKSKWLWIGLAALVLIILALPVTRYRILGLFLKQTVAVAVIDSKTHTPVSGAVITAHGVSGKTDAAGQAKLKVPLGQTKLDITKQYYQSATQSYFVGLKAGPTTHVGLVATGRQVPVTIINKVTGKPLANALISVLDTTAKTNAKGEATIVLPTKTATVSATVTLSGYNTAHSTLTVTSDVLPANSVSLTPSGTIYFLSNLNGTIDVVRTNLDGTGRQTVLKGTGKEDPDTTSLLASRDWRFLVLKAQRDTAQPSLYIIDTATNKVTSFDSGNTDFSLVGWSGHYFVYNVTRTPTDLWQAGRQLVKSYNADTAQLNQLDQNQAEGNSTSYAYQSFYNFYLTGTVVSYTTQWYSDNANGAAYDLGSKSDTIRAIQPNGQGKKDYQSFAAQGVSYIQAALYEPNGIYYSVYSYADSKTVYYQFEDLAVKTVNNVTAADFNKLYPTYLLSPGGQQTFWSELRDGKNSLFVGDDNAGNKQQIATLSDYAPYGWYSDDYLLVSKNSSELYIMPKGGLSGSQQPLKISDYYKPAQTYNGYGGGYGGL